MPVRLYRLTASPTGSVVGQAQTVVVGDGRIVGVAFIGSMTASAGSQITVELAINNPAFSNAVAPTLAQSDQILTRFVLGGSAANPQVNVNGYCPCSRAVGAGNLLCINATAAAGAAITATVLGFDVMIEER